ncbi:hypothetical protein FQA39_LY15697 [Lamprigera yunnana]|nr:hypothetical protein FQA39_LY15697 [Lamprigera yunnana]
MDTKEEPLTWPAPSSDLNFLGWVKEMTDGQGNTSLTKRAIIKPSSSSSTSSKKFERNENHSETLEKPVTMKIKHSCAENVDKKTEQKKHKSRSSSMFRSSSKLDKNKKTSLIKSAIIKPVSSSSSSKRKFNGNENNENHSGTLKDPVAINRGHSCVDNVDKKTERKKHKSRSSSTLQSSSKLDNNKTSLIKRAIIKPVSSSSTSSKEFERNKNNENRSGTLKKPVTMKRKQSSADNVDTTHKSGLSSMLQSSNKLDNNKETSSIKRVIIKPSSSSSTSSREFKRNENNENRSGTLKKPVTMKRRHSCADNVDKKTERKKHKSGSSSMLQSSNQLNKNKKTHTKELKDDPDIDIEASIKYGAKVPSIKYIMEYKKNFEEEQRQIEELRKGVDFTIEEEPINLSSIYEAPKPRAEVLNCKHLTSRDLKETLKQNYKFLYDIYHGISYCRRHQLFYENGSTSHLSNNVSMIAFTYPQLKVFLNFFDNKFDNSLDKISYYFQVLLPEVCMKVFMDTHRMTHQEALEYLSKPH